jgi:hypothetical protein
VVENDLDRANSPGKHIRKKFEKRRVGSHWYWWYRLFFDSFLVDDLLTWSMLILPNPALMLLCYAHDVVLWLFVNCSDCWTSTSGTRTRLVNPAEPLATPLGYDHFICNSYVINYCSWFCYFPFSTSSFFFFFLPINYNP